MNWWASVNKTFRSLLLGKKRNPFSADESRRVALIAFLAWVGLGADGISSACYGPEEAFIALGAHPTLAIFIAAATAITVFVIALAYNQVVELFPSGGGGYKVATQLLGSHAGLVSGAALLVDYVLTIAISIASGTDALYSLLPTEFGSYKLITEFLLVLLLILLNVRGMKESVIFLMPIFLGFIIFHVGLIVYGISFHRTGLGPVISQSMNDTKSLASTMGWFAVIGFLLHSYSLGGGTYTGLEAVSNNVNRLAEPRIRTGKWTMFYMAVSLSFTAAGLILLYLLWGARSHPGQTLNAVVFDMILGPSMWGQAVLIVTLFLEAGILFVAANTGFLAGPVVLANMSVDKWVPNRFRHLSNRLVILNGIILFGLAAMAILYWTHGKVSILVILYSINVFLTFTITLLGLCVYWIVEREKASKYWTGRLAFSFFAFVLTGGILLVMLFTKFTEGGWLTVIITTLVIFLCLMVKSHYTSIANKLAAIDLAAGVKTKPLIKIEHAPMLNHSEPTAIFFIGEDLSVGMHTLLWAMRLFPNHFKNFIFLRVGVVDMQSFSGQTALDEMKTKVEETLNYYVNFCQQHGYAARSYADYGTDVVDHLMELSAEAAKDFPNSIFFASRLIFDHENWITRLLHNETPMVLQRRLHNMGQQLIILPMKI